MTVKIIKQYPYKSTGREPHVFRAEGPQGLLGEHAALVDSALNPGESIHYLLYTPIREAGMSPFGIHAEPASHALAVTDHRFLLSKDRHINTIAPTIREIPYSRVIGVEIGNALLLGWLAIHFIENGQPACASMFYTARGSHHFERAICEFRNMYGKSQNYIPAEGTTWADVWEKTPKMQSDIIKSLILKKENPLLLLRSNEIWGAQKRGKKKILLAPNSVLLVTDWGFIHAVDEQPVSPQMLSYGVNVRCIPLDALYSIEHCEKEEYGICRHILRLQTGIHPAIMNTEIRFDDRANDGVAEFVRAIQSMQGK